MWISSIQFFRRGVGSSHRGRRGSVTMRSVTMCWTLTVTALLFFCTPFMMGQTSATGALGGTVTDSSGALIPNVTVTAILNLDTGQQRILNYKRGELLHRF